MQSKWVLTSKTVWFNFVVAAASFYGPAGEWVASNPAVFATVWAVLAVGLRAITKDKVQLLP